ncbi:DNA-directed RNA polymerase I subunit RPA43 (RPA4) [Vairimorpha necatrix]|uniref:DNA-directed RNA polymerase I subunit RPA43 (RPA4) n=1 Tax=Vairimorpha necatrix TaxID=6039 RepID=A0AAX4JAY2_9MICR
MKIRKIKVQIIIKISPIFFNDPDTEINKRLSSYLFKYTYKLSGIPLCYKIVGVFPVGHIINDNEYVFLKSIVEFDLLCFKIGDILESEDGVSFGIIYAKINGEEFYTGKYKVEDIENNKEECSSILGSPVGTT